MKFDNKEKCVLQLIYDNKGIMQDKILKKYPGYGMFLINCCKNKYLLAQNEENNFVTFESMPYTTTPNTRFFTTPKSNMIVEQDKKETTKDNFSRAIAVISLLISLTALVFSGIAVLG